MHHPPLAPSEKSAAEPRPDEHREPLAARLPPQLIRELSRIEPLRSLWHVALEWAAIAVAVALCEQLGRSWWWYAVTVAFVGGRQHALFHLAHEATHWHLFNHRKLNDWFADVFLAWPCLHSVPLYRQRHFGHHRNIGTLDDPHIHETYARDRASWDFPKTSLGLARWLAYRLLGLTFPRQVFAFLKGFGRGPSPGLIACKVLYYAALVACVTALDAWDCLLLYWFVPLATWTPMIRDFRLASEHFAIDGEVDALGGKSRSVLPTWPERLFVCSKNTFLHSEHHDYPSVPFYQLPRVHQAMRSNPRLAPRLHLTRGYFRVVSQLASRSVSPRSDFEAERQH